MWTEKRHEVNFQFSEGEEILLIPAMDEYGRGVPYLFATRPIEELPEGTCHKYVDINCPQIAVQTENPTVRLVQHSLSENGGKILTFPIRFGANFPLNQRDFLRNTSHKC